MYMFGFLRRRKKEEVPVSNEHEHEFGLGEEHSVLDFEDTLTRLQQLSPKAQATFLYRLVGVLPMKLVITVRKYALKRENNDKGINIGQNSHHSDGSARPKRTSRS